MDAQEITRKVCEKIRLYRKQASLSRQDVACKMGKSAAWLVSLENARIAPTLPVLYGLADLFGCSVYDLLPDNRASLSSTPVTGNLTSFNLRDEVMRALDQKH